MKTPSAPRPLPSTLLRAVRLAGTRMATSGAWKFSRVIAALVAFWLTLAVVYLAVKGHGNEVQGVVTRAAVWIAWLGGTILAWWCAGDRAGVDRLEGIELLARIHGIDPRTLAWGRVLSATLRITALVGVTSIPVVFASLAAAPTLHDGLMRLASLAPLGGFALGVGLVAGALACGCGWFSPRRGRAWLTALVFVPWALDGVLVPTRANVASVPGMLGFLADLVTRVGGGA
jgi:hypothetical protein